MTCNPTSSNHHEQEQEVDLLLFDLDGTLYDEECGYVDEIHSNVYNFMAESTGGKFDDIRTVEEAKVIWKPIFEKYNQSKRGLLQEGYVFDSKEYDTYVRKGASKYFSTPDVELRTFLQSLHQRKVIFTNAPEESAKEILTLLGVDDLFEAVLGSDFLQNQVCKPEKKAFQMVLDHLNVKPSNYHRVCYFEDSYKNMCMGKQLGFKTVFVKSPTMTHEGRSLSDLSQFDALVDKKVGMGLRTQMPYLWNDTNGDETRCSLGHPELKN